MAGATTATGRPKSMKSRNSGLARIPAGSRTSPSITIVRHGSASSARACTNTIGSKST
jgi:hypothetical protein